MSHYQLFTSPKFQVLQEAKSCDFCKFSLNQKVDSILVLCHWMKMTSFPNWVWVTQPCCMLLAGWHQLQRTSRYSVRLLAWWDIYSSKTSKEIGDLPAFCGCSTLTAIYGIQVEPEGDREQLPLSITVLRKCCLSRKGNVQSQQATWGLSPRIQGKGRERFQEYMGNKL